MGFYTSVLRALTSNTHRHFVNPSALPWRVRIRSVTVVWNERNGMRTWGQMFADMAEGGDAGEGGYERACSLSELQAAGRKRVTVQGRIVALFHVSGQVYALDHFCYREYKPWEQTGDLVHYTLYCGVHTETVEYFYLLLSDAIFLMHIQINADAGGPLELGDIEVNSRPPFYCMSPLPYGCVPVPQS